MARPAFVGSIAAFLATLALSAPVLADSLTYENARFGTRITFPAELFETRMEPPANGDGMTWTNVDGASLAVYAMNNALMVTPAEFLEKAREENRDATYGSSGSDWVVISGFDGSDVFYQRWVFGSDDVLHAVLLRYPESLKSDYDPLVGPIAGSLTAP